MKWTSDVSLPDRLPPQTRSFLLGAIVLLSLLLYANAALNGFVYDDHSQIETNRNVHSFAHLADIFGSSTAAQQGKQAWANSYRPLVNFIFLLCYKLFGLSPYGYHLINILFHCSVVALICLVSTELFSSDSFGLMAAAIFALHPVHTEPVAWIDGISDPSVSVFYLLAFWFFLRQGTQLSVAHISPRVGMIGSFILALLCKETAMTFPVLVTAYEHFCRPDRNATGWKTKLSRYAGVWITHLIYLVVRARALGTLSPPPMHPDLTVREIFCSGLALVAQYAGALVWPVPLLAFAPFHKSVSFADPRVLAGAFVVVVACVAFVLLWKRARLYAFALFWIALTIAPALNARWMAANVFAERYLYLPSVGFCWLLAGTMLWCWRKTSPNTTILRWVLVTAAAFVALMASAEIVARNRDWRNDRTLILATLKVKPDAANMHSDLGLMEWFDGNHDEAERQWQLALHYRPDTVEVFANLGMARLEQGRYDEAISFLQKAIRLKPRFATPHIYLARVYVAQGKPDDAEVEFRRAVEIYPLNADGRKALGQFYLDSGRLAEAAEQFLASIAAAPDFPAWYGLAQVYDREQSLDKAEDAWRTVLSFEPFEPQAHLSLGRIYLAKGEFSAAQREFDACLVMQPANPEALAARRKLIEHSQRQPSPASTSR